MNGRFARGLYSALLRALAPAYVLRLWWRGRAEPMYRHAIGERLGAYDGEAQTGALWIHAVSLGETRAAGALIAALREQHPALRFVLTHGTATGREAGQALLREGDEQVWLPYDTPGVVQRFFQRFRPALGVLMETEIWPNLLQGAQQAGVPMVLANARLSARSLARGQRLAPVMQPAAEALRLALAQTEADATRLREAGVREVEVCGNLKFDMTPDESLATRGRAWRVALQRPVVLAAVTREGEETMLLDAWCSHESSHERSQGQAPDAHVATRPLLLIVPRHPQRFDDVVALVKQAGLTVARRSTWSDAPALDALAADVWVGDSMREMSLYYGLSDVALLGGSYAPLGGQNLIEAAACGCPVVMGPHTYNFAEAAELSQAAGAALRVADMAEGVARALALLQSPEERDDRARRAVAFAEQHRGAAQRMAQRIGALLPR